MGDSLSISFRLTSDGGIVMRANAESLVIAGEQALAGSTSVPASESIQECALSPAETRLALALLIVTVLLVVTVGVYVGTRYGVVWGLAAVVFASSVVAATIGVCAFVTGRPHDGM